MLGQFISGTKDNATIILTKQERFLISPVSRIYTGSRYSWKEQFFQYEQRVNSDIAEILFDIWSNHFNQE